MECRKNQATLSSSEKSAYVNAVLALKKTCIEVIHRYIILAIYHYRSYAVKVK
jgi:hypothetical protein